MRFKPPQTMEEAYRLLAAVGMTQFAGLKEDDVLLMLPVIDLFARKIVESGGTSFDLSKGQMLRAIADAMDEREKSSTAGAAAPASNGHKGR